MRKKVLSVALSAAMALSMTSIPAFAATDDQGHWAEAALGEWQDYGVIQGYEDGSVRPDAPITRGEMGALLDRTMGYQEKADDTFTDLAGNWSADYMLRAVAAGVFEGDGDSTVRPDDRITRQEATLVLARVLDLDGEEAPDAGFSDEADVAPWADAAVDAMADAGYVHGYGDDGTFRPDADITRAEVVTILDNAFANLYQAEGEYTGDVEGSAVVKADGTVLKDMTIKGDLIVAEGVADGHVELDNVTVEGRLIVRGGGENSVIIKGASKIGQIIVDRLAGAVRVAVQDAAEVAGVVVSEGTEGVRLEGNIGDLSVQGAASVVEVAGTVGDVEVAESAEDAKVTILEGSEAEAVKSQAKTATIVIGGTVATVSISGEGNQLTVSGTVTTVDVAGNGAVVKVEASATVEKVNTSASGTTVEGEGEVGSVVAGEGSSDVTVSTENTDVENNGSGDVSIEGGTVAPGETDTTPGGTTSGGGSTGGGVVTPPVTYYTVTFQKADGTTIATQSVASGATAAKLTDSTADYPTVEEGQQLVWYNGADPYDFSTAVTENLKLTAVVGSDKFAGGNGTVNYPYLVSTADQLAAIDSLSNQMQAGTEYHFELTANIDYTEQTTCIYRFCGVFDGQGHTIAIGQQSGGSLFGYTSNNATFKNITIKQMNKKLAMLVVFANVPSNCEVVFDGITCISGLENGTLHEAYMYGSGQFVGMTGYGNITFKNCTNKVDYRIPDGAEGDYAGIFIGNYISNKAPSVISYIGCVNEGLVNGNQVGFFFGNSNAASKSVHLVDAPNATNDDPNSAAIYVSGCSNSGEIVGTLNCEAFLSLGDQTGNDDANAQLADKEGAFDAGTMCISTVDGMGLLVESTSQDAGNVPRVKIASTEDNGVSSYSVSYSVSTTYKNELGSSLGSWYFSVVEELNASEASEKTFDYITQVMMDTAYNNTAAEGEKYNDLVTSNRAIVKRDIFGNEYILVSNDDGSKTAVLNSSQMAKNYDQEAVTVACAADPSYAIVARDSQGLNIGTKKYPSGKLQK